MSMQKSYRDFHCAIMTMASACGYKMEAWELENYNHLIKDFGVSAALAGVESALIDLEDGDQFPSPFLIETMVRNNPAFKKQKEYQANSYG